MLSVVNKSVTIADHVVVIVRGCGLAVFPSEIL